MDCIVVQFPFLLSPMFLQIPLAEAEAVFTLFVPVFMCQVVCRTIEIVSNPDISTIVQQHTHSFPSSHSSTGMQGSPPTRTGVVDCQRSSSQELSHQVMMAVMRCYKKCSPGTVFTPLGTPSNVNRARKAGFDVTQQCCSQEFLPHPPNIDSQCSLMNNVVITQPAGFIHGNNIQIAQVVHIWKNTQFLFKP